MTNSLLGAAIQAGEAGIETVLVLDTAAVLDLAIRALVGELAAVPAGKKPVVGMHLGHLDNALRARRTVKNRRCRQRQSEGKAMRAGCYDLAGKGGCGHPKHGRPEGKPR